MSVNAIKDLVFLPENRAAMRLLLRSTMAMGGIPVAVYYFCFNTVPYNSHTCTHKHSSGYCLCVNTVNTVHPFS